MSLNKQGLEESAKVFMFCKMSKDNSVKFATQSSEAIIEAYLDKVDEIHRSNAALMYAADMKLRESREKSNETN